MCLQLCHILCVTEYTVYLKHKSLYQTVNKWTCILRVFSIVNAPCPYTWSWMSWSNCVSCHHRATVHQSGPIVVYRLTVGWCPQCFNRILTAGMDSSIYAAAALLLGSQMLSGFPFSTRSKRIIGVSFKLEGSGVPYMLAAKKNKLCDSRFEGRLIYSVIIISQ